MGKAGVKVDYRDVAEVMELQEKRIDNGSRETADLLMLSLVVAEFTVLLCKDHWWYEQKFETVLSDLRVSAKILAIKFYREWKRGEKD